MGQHLRYRVDPGDVPPAKAARRLHLTPDEFEKKLPELIARGFPKPDETTGMYDLDAIDEWRKRRNPQLMLTSTETPRDARSVARDRLKGLRDG